MRKVIVSLALTGLCFAAPAAPAAAQNTFGIGAFAGVSLPMGDYGDSGTTGSGAELGFTGGIDLFYPLAMMGQLNWLTSVSVTAHSVSDDWMAGVSGGYLFVPAMTGLRFDVPAGPLALFLTGQLGVVLGWGPDVADESSSMGTSFGFALGGGVQATPNIYAGVKYFPLGTMDFDTAPAERSVSYLDIFLGFGVR